MFLNEFFHRFNRISPVMVQTPWVGSYGNCAEDIYFGFLKARSEGKKVLFLFPHDLPRILRFSKVGINGELLKVQSPYRFLSHRNPISKLGGWSLSIAYYLIRIFVKLWEKLFRRKVSGSYMVPDIGRKALWCGKDSNRFSAQKVKRNRWKEQFDHPIQVEMPPESLSHARRMRIAMGIPEGDWFACLHVREGGYYSHREGREKNIRNATPGHFLKAIESIIATGGWVVRMGDNTMTPLPERERFIDYPHTEHKSDLMDIYLIQECRFFLGTVSGVLPVANLFQKPVLLTNMYEWLRIYPLKKGDLCILKHPYSVRDGRFLSLQDNLEAFRDNPNLFWTDEYELHENTDEEIVSLVKEYMERPSCVHSELQLEWNRRRVEVGYEVLQHSSDYKMATKPWESLTDRFLCGAYLEGGGTVAQGFLESNWERNSLNPPY